MEDGVRGALERFTGGKSLAVRLGEKGDTLGQLQDFLRGLGDEEAAALGPVLDRQLEKIEDLVSGAGSTWLKVITDRPVFKRHMNRDHLELRIKELRSQRELFREKRDRRMETQRRVMKRWQEPWVPDCLDKLGGGREVLYNMANVAKTCSLAQAILHVNLVAFERLCRNQDHPGPGRRKTAKLTLGDWEEAARRVKQGLPVPAPLEDGGLRRINARLGRFAQLEPAVGVSPERHGDVWAAVEAAAESASTTTSAEADVEGCQSAREAARQAIVIAEDRADGIPIRKQSNENDSCADDGTDKVSTRPQNHQDESVAKDAADQVPSPPRSHKEISAVDTADQVPNPAQSHQDERSAVDEADQVCSPPQGFQDESGAGDRAGDAAAEGGRSVRDRPVRQKRGREAKADESCNVIEVAMPEAPSHQPRTSPSANHLVERGPSQDVEFSQLNTNRAKRAKLEKDQDVTGQDRKVKHAIHPLALAVFMEELAGYIPLDMRPLLEVSRQIRDKIQNGLVFEGLPSWDLSGAIDDNGLMLVMEPRKL